MSEDSNDTAPQQQDDQARAAARLQQQREALAKARAARGTKAKTAPVRKAQTRTAPQRTASDSRVGVSAHPEPAERRDAPIREAMRPGAEVKLTRRKRHERTTGMLDVPKHLKKPGWDYQWITLRVLNQEVDASRLRDFREGGWRPVLARDMPDLADDNAPPDSPIESEGLRLMLRPMSLTMEARQEDMVYAQEQQRDKTMAAASGRSAVRGEEGIPDSKGVRRVPMDIVIEGLAG